MNLNNYLISYYTGPAWINQIADQVKSAGVTVQMIGTEKLLVTMIGTDLDNADNNVRGLLRYFCGSDLGLTLCDWSEIVE
jgi:hypothetical protein